MKLAGPADADGAETGGSSGVVSSGVASPDTLAAAGTVGTAVGRTRAIGAGGALAGGFGKAVMGGAAGAAGPIGAGGAVAEYSRRVVLGGEASADGFTTLGTTAGVEERWPDVSVERRPVGCGRKFRWGGGWCDGGHGFFGLHRCDNRRWGGDRGIMRFRVKSVGSALRADFSARTRGYGFSGLSYTNLRNT